MPSAESVARYFLHLAAAGPEPTPVTQMQLHKLLYYAQGWNLAQRGAALFADSIEAWMHGPVVAQVFPKFADYGNAVIAPHESDPGAELSPNDRLMIEQVWQRYGRFSAAHLRAMTHREGPWMEARRGLSPDAPGRKEITGETLKAFFSEMRSKEFKRLGVDEASLARSIEQARNGDLVDVNLAARGPGDVHRRQANP